MVCPTLQVVYANNGVVVDKEHQEWQFTFQLRKIQPLIWVYTNVKHIPRRWEYYVRTEAPYKKDTGIVMPHAMIMLLNKNLDFGQNLEIGYII